MTDTATLRSLADDIDAMRHQIRQRDATIILLRAERDTLRASNRGICALADERVAEIHRLRLEVRALERKNALLRSGIDPDESIAEIVALCLNIRTIGERIGEHLDEVPVC